MNRRINQVYRMAHFVLAVFCRVENNRLYLQHGIEIRPGFNAQWITFHVLETNDLNSYIAIARERFLKPSLEHRNKLFGEEINSNPVLVAE